MTIKGQEYLYLSPDGVWQFQIYIPSYMRHMFGGKRLYLDWPPESPDSWNHLS